MIGGGGEQGERITTMDSSTSGSSGSSSAGEYIRKFLQYVCVCDMVYQFGSSNRFAEEGGYLVRKNRMLMNAEEMPWTTRITQIRQYSFLCEVDVSYIGKRMSSSFFVVCAL